MIACKMLGPDQQHSYVHTVQEIVMASIGLSRVGYEVTRVKQSTSRRKDELNHQLTLS